LKKWTDIANPSPEVRVPPARRKCATSSITKPWMVRFRSNLVLTLDTSFTTKLQGHGSIWSRSAWKRCLIAILLAEVAIFLVYLFFNVDQSPPCGWRQSKVCF